ncbi:hypothetical protein AB0I60_34755 [Actinosynnema sp. NPDC050436]|uniref:hypothetical protein n=1 Tax=Actinosynnema sp. NPDC050436 TaxID=3155659 RepID=UPI0033D7F516
MVGESDAVRRCSCGTRLARDNRTARCGSCARAGRHHVSAAPPDVPAQFWDHPDLRAALATRDIGAVIRAYRRHPHHGQPIRQATVAAWIDLSATRLSRVENGEPVNDLTKFIRWTQLLRIPQHLLWFRAPSLSVCGTPAAVAAASAAAARSTAEKQLMTAAEESSAFLEWAEATNVGDLTVDQLHAEARRIAHTYLKVPTLPVFSRARALRDRAASLLTGRQAPQHTRELYAAAGWSLTMLSWISVDLGRPDAAEDHARAAWMCAERSDHNPLRAWVRATQHTAAFWRSDYTTAARYAADGLRYGGTGTAEVFLSSALALDLARAAQPRRAHAPRTNCPDR